ncbi:MAG TPA: response regulator [Candidatus Krumholzibacteria bacterium]|nr:response regulator [Candidatus Krumholzibacteria bacterium]
MSRVMESVTPRPRAEPALLTPGARLVLAEDDLEMRRLLAWSLRRAGYEVVEAGNGSELLERVEDCERNATPAQLVITDLRMPGVTGLQAIEYLRQSGRSIPVILITAFGDPTLHQRAPRFGACAVLDKPFESEQLEALIDRWSRPAHGR